jgi:uncharacterized membrane protein YeaQ/YmgE (transglycosylase-associated protein family)
MRVWQEDQAALSIIVLIAIAAVIVLFVGLWLSANLIGVILTLFIAGLIGWLADQAVPGSIPYGWLGAIVAGLLGSFLGELILGGLGPEVAGISLVPAFIGAVVLAFGTDLFLKARGSEA